jgi:hypothetical protein
MKKILFHFLFLIITGMGFANDARTVTITLMLSPMCGGGEIEVYNGSYDGINRIMKKISTAWRAFAIVKEALWEGEYIVNVYNNGLLVQTYLVMNSSNVYDRTNDRYLKCDILLDIRSLLVPILLFRLFPETGD